MYPTAQLAMPYLNLVLILIQRNKSTQNTSIMEGKSKTNVLFMKIHILDMLPSKCIT